MKTFMVSSKYLDAFKLLHQYLKHTQTHQPQKLPLLLLEHSKLTQSGVTVAGFISTCQTDYWKSSYLQLSDGVRRIKGSDNI